MQTDTRRLALLPALGGVVCAAVVLAAQEPTAPPPVFRAGIDLIQLDVSVLDEKRRPVRGLTAEDFSVVVDGQPRPVVTFRPVELPPPPPPTAAPWVRDVAPDVVTNIRPSGRVVAIVIDDGSFGVPRVADLFTVRKTRELARAAVDQLGPEDLAAVLFTENSRTSQGFTTDRQRLLAAIDAAALAPSPDAGMRTDISSYADDVNDSFGVNRPNCDCGVCSIDAVGRIADALRPLAGQRKLVIFISAGVRVDAQVPVPYDAIGKSYIFRVEHCNALKQKAMADVFRRAALSNVTIQAVDARGLLAADRAATLSDIGAVETTGGIDLRVEFLQTMAESTGGRAVVRNNDMEREIPALFEETSAYYLLGVEAPPSSDNGRLHRLQVRVDRPGVEVRTRHGYYTPTPDDRKAAAATVAGDVNTAIAGVLPRTDLPLDVSVVPFADPDDPARSALAIVLAVTPPNASRGVARRERLTVVATAFQPESGASIPSHEQTLELAWNATEGASTQFEVLSRLAAPPGRYEVRVGVEAGDGRAASIFTYADVPDFDDAALSASGLVLGATPSPRIAGAGAIATLTPVVPTSRRTFAATDRVTAFLHVYQARQPFAPATVTTRITDTGNDVIAELTEPVEGHPLGRMSAADYRIDLPIDELAPGEYLLTMEAARDGTTVRRTARFRVE
jgi:VWFA-related protein